MAKKKITCPAQFELLVFHSDTGTGAGYYNDQKLIELVSGQDVTGNVAVVNTGDRMAWKVVAILPNGQRVQPPYVLDFSKNPSFFGTSTVNVTAGGVSPFLDAVPYQAAMKYAVSIPSLGYTLDPDIQSGPDSGTLPGRLDVVPDVVVTWDVAGEMITYTVGGVAGNLANIPICTKYPTIEFVATEGTDFSVTFGFTTNLWATPFNEDPASLTLKAPDLNTPQLQATVTDSAPADANAVWPFQCNVTWNGARVPSPVAYLAMTVCP